MRTLLCLTVLLVGCAPVGEAYITSDPLNGRSAVGRIASANLPANRAVNAQTTFEVFVTAGPTPSQRNYRLEFDVPGDSSGPCAITVTVPVVTASDPSIAPTDTREFSSQCLPLRPSSTPRGANCQIQMYGLSAGGLSVYGVCTYPTSEYPPGVEYVFRTND